MSKILNVGDKYQNGIVCMVSTGEFYKKTNKSIDLNAWAKFPNWETKNVYHIQFSEPVYSLTEKEWYEVMPNLSNFIIPEKKTEYYKTFCVKSYILAIPQDAIE